MKKLLLASALLIGLMTSCDAVHGYANWGLNVNIGSQPAWGPAGYNYVDYYYLPDINCYYNVNLGLFYYLNFGRWYSSAYLPSMYSNYNLYSMYKAVIVGVSNPWRYNNIDRRRYTQFIGVGNQQILRDSPGYRSSRNNSVARYNRNMNNYSARRESQVMRSGSSRSKSYAGNYGKRQGSHGSKSSRSKGGHGKNRRG